jgi:nicotinamide-nucleotide amidase
MNVELICVGSELLSGDIVNTNASYILKELQKLGHTAQHQSCVDDNKERLGGVIAESLKRCKLLIISGGLGPTDDDITKETVCETLGIKLEENSFCRNHLENHFKGLGKTPTENNYKQAMAPENSRIFINEKGTACGICIEKDGNTIIMLPGPPKELTHMALWRRR